MKDFWLCFIPLFVAVDALGVLPMFTSLTADIETGKKRRIIRQSVATASFVSLIFLFAGKALLRLLGITVADFMIAGGVLLFVISISDILRSEKVQRQVDPDSLGAVPIGVPLIAGPAVLTTSVLVMDQYGYLLSSAALIINIMLAGLV
ncbi:MarC family protein, partial [Fibrobacterota bacterium]